jgi:hypothetical protein
MATAPTQHACPPRVLSGTGWPARTLSRTAWPRLTWAVLDPNHTPLLVSKLLKVVHVPTAPPLVAVSISRMGACDAQRIRSS